MTSQPGVFAAGDTVRGASLVVHAITKAGRWPPPWTVWPRGRGVV